MSKKEGTMSMCAECGGAYYVAPSGRKRRAYCSRKCRASAQSKWQRQDLSSRFWGKVEKTESCWIWHGALMKTGYGSIGIDGVTRRAHRVAYELVHGKIPEGMLLRHSCDNPRCVNPAHLTPGTKSENYIDALDRGQIQTGERHHRAKLTDEDMVMVLASLNAGVQGRVIAKRFGVSESIISKIKLGHRRKHSHCSQNDSM